MKKEKFKNGNHGTDFDIPPLTEEELELLKTAQGDEDRSTMEPYDTSDLAHAKRYVKKNIFSVLFVVLTILLLIVVLAVLGIMVYRTADGKPSKDDYTVNIGEEEQKIVLSNKDYTIDGAFYFDIRLIAPYADLVVSGDGNRIKVSCPDGTYVRFTDTEETAVVNGTRVLLGGKAIIKEKTKKSELQCLVPFSFVQDLFSYPVEENTPGLRVKFSEDDNTVIIRRVTYSDTGEPLKISFSADCFTIAEDMQMQADRSKYPQLAFACIKSTQLINKGNPLGDTYIPEGLLSLNGLGCPCVEGREFSLVNEAANALVIMLADMKESVPEENMLVTSAYRSYEYQVEIFNLYLNNLMNKGMTLEEATAQLTLTSAFPGESEHQSGLCVDLIEKGTKNLSVTFGDTKSFQWLSENAHRYGFILRYPEGKESITGYEYEPWHYRFVGLDAARIIYEDKVCLEEYLGKL